MNLSTAIKKEMERQSITQSELSRLLKQDRQTINKNLKNWNNGKIPTIPLLKKWCTALKCDYKKFLQYM